MTRHSHRHRRTPDRVTGGFTVSQAMGLTPDDSDGITILLMGLDSRKDQNGDDLPAEVLQNLHAGDSDRADTTPIPWS